MPVGDSQSSSFAAPAAYLVLSADDFITSPCDELFQAKERIFRRYDVAPNDGVLTFNELTAAAQDQAADTYLLKRWNSAQNLSLSLGQLMKAQVYPSHCTQPEDQQMLFERIVYPSTEPGRETSKSQCKRDAGEMTARWQYGEIKQLSRGDALCVYIDGILYAEDVPRTQKLDDSDFKLLNGMFISTQVTDRRPVFGAFKDVQPSLVAQFTFDDEGGNAKMNKTSDSVFSGADTSNGQVKRPKLKTSGQISNWIHPCAGGAGGMCLSGRHGDGFEYRGDPFSGDIAFSTWLQVKRTCNSAETTKIIQFYSKSGEFTTFVSLELSCSQSSVTLKHYARAASGNVKPISPEISIQGLKRSSSKDGNLSPWYLVGFALAHGSGASVFALPAEKNVASLVKTEPKWKLGIIDMLSSIKLFQLGSSSDTSSFQFDDVRFYTGSVGSAAVFFGSTQACGRSAYCALRARARPGSRRVVCLSMVRVGARSTSFACAGGLFYDGTAIDVKASMDMTGVTFAFRDTSWAENGFEIERKRADVKDATKFNTVVLVEADLKGCASIFNSLTYLDRDAGTAPNSKWVYRITTKIPSETGGEPLYKTSSMHNFQAPWLSVLAGRVVAGTTDVPVPYVRICAEFQTFLKTGRPVQTFDVARSQIQNIAVYKPVTHSSKKNEIRAQGFTLTDGDLTESSYVPLEKDEFVRVNLGEWTSISSVRVCVHAAASKPVPSFEAFVSDPDPEDSGNHGNKCLVKEGGEFFIDDEKRLCVDYECSGSRLKSFHGEHVTVKSTSPATLNVREVEVYGNLTRCQFSAVTDKDGEYGIEIRDTTGVVPVKTKLHVGAYKEEIFPHSTELLIDTRVSEGSDNRTLRLSAPTAVVLTAVMNTTKKMASHKSMPFKSVSDVFDGALNDTVVTRKMLEQYMNEMAGFGSDSFVVIPDDVWIDLDEDEDGVLNHAEFQNATQRMNSKDLAVEPLLAFPTIPTREFHSFQTTMHDGKNAVEGFCENLVLRRKSTSNFPTQEEWRTISSEIIDQNTVYNYVHCRKSSSSRADSIIVGESGTYLLPIMISKPETSIFYLDAKVDVKSDQRDSLRLFERAVSGRVHAQVHAVHQLPDMQHTFDRPPKRNSKPGSNDESTSDLIQHTFSNLVKMKETLMEVKHKRIEEKDFTDDTVAIVTGAVLFPKSRAVGSSDCGLPKVKLEVFEPDKSPDFYETDDAGWFRLALPRGKTITIRATYENHVICFAGENVEDAVDNLDSCEGRLNSTTIESLEDGQTLFFSDHTPSQVLLGVYQGECDAIYPGAKFKIWPASGCHAPVFVTSEFIDGAWSRVDDTSKIRSWPYAALNYNVELVSAPDIDGYDKHYPNLAQDCETEPGSMLSFFRNRDTLNRILPFQNEHMLVEERFKYHGYICVDVQDIPPVTDADTMCYDEKELPGNLTSKHFIGTSKYADLTVSASKFISAKVFELHLLTDSETGAQSLKKCFTNLPNGDDGSGSTKLSFRQDVTDEDSNECHPNRGGGPSCDFDVVVETNGLMQFPKENGLPSTNREITAGSPNLGGTHRRKLDFTIERFDGYRTVRKLVSRPLVTLGSKPRSPDNVLSDDVKWATVPIEGLVYTVVHDPPGGDSYAELAVGSTVGVQVDLSGTRAAGKLEESESEVELPEKDFSINPGYNLGYTAEGNMNLPTTLLTFKGNQKFETDGPNFEMKSTNHSGWSMETTTNRVIRSSQDHALTGRSGDVILGGGVELLYRESDILDIVKDGRTNNKPCLFNWPELTWLPRKPTSYVFSVAAVELHVVPNLKYLLSVVKAGGIAADNSGMLYDCAKNTLNDESVSKCTDFETTTAWESYLYSKLDAWRRTLAWASPQVYLEEGEEGKTKVYDAIERISEPIAAGKHAIRQRFEEKMEMFDDELFLPIDDTVEELSNTWDASNMFQPKVGAFGPPPNFPSIDVDLFEKFYEPEDGSDITWDRITGASDEPEEEEDEMEGMNVYEKLKYVAEQKVTDTVDDAKNKVDIKSRVEGIVDDAKSVAEDSGDLSKEVQSAIESGDVNSASSISDDASSIIEDAQGVANDVKAIYDDAKGVYDAAKGFYTQHEKAITAFAKKMESNKAAQAASAFVNKFGSLANGVSSASDKKKEALAKKMGPIKEKLKKVEELQDKAKKSTAMKVLMSAKVLYEMAQYLQELKTQMIDEAEVPSSGYGWISYPRDRYKKNLPKYEDTFYDGDYDRGVFTWGMLEGTMDDLTESFQSCRGVLCEKGEFDAADDSLLSVKGTSAYNMGEDYFLSPKYSADRVSASFTGGTAQSGMRVRGQSNPLEPHQDVLLLTFSGGGHSAEYSFSSAEKMSDDMYGIGVSVTATQHVEHEVEFGGLIGMAINAGLAAAGEDTSGDMTVTKTMTYDRSFAWNKHGSMSSSYTLGDPNIGDKFVVKVAADKRFGTPVFTTMGGRSSCPGEPLTVWRESGYVLDLASTPTNLDLNPGEQAIIQLKIQTGTMYRESFPLGLRIVDGLASSIQEILDAANKAYHEDDDPKSISHAINTTAASVVASQDAMVKRIKDKVGTAVARNQNPSTVIAVARNAAQTAPALGSDVNDVEISINGVNISPLGELVPLEVINSDSFDSQKRVTETTFTMRVKPLSSITRAVKYMKVRVQSMCESSLDNLNREPIQQNQYLQKMTWSQKCPEVRFDGETLRDYKFSQVSKARPDALKLKVFNPDRSVLWPDALPVKPTTNPNLAAIKVQYRPVGEGEWISAKSSAEHATTAEKSDSFKKNLLCPHSRGGGCPFAWDVNNEFDQMLSGFKDGTYEVRVKSFCVKGDVFAETSVHEFTSDEVLTLVVDTVKPLASELKQYPSTRTVGVTYYEPIDCSKVQTTVRRIFDEKCAPANEQVSLTDIKSNYKIVCTNSAAQGKWVMQYPNDISGTFEVKVTNVLDAAGNCEGFNAKTCEGNTLRFTTGEGAKVCGASALLGTNPRSSDTRVTWFERGHLGDRLRVSLREVSPAFGQSAVPLALAAVSLFIAAVGLLVFMRRRSSASEVVKGSKAHEHTSLVRSVGPSAYGSAV